MADLSTVQWRVIVAGRRIPCLLTRVHGVIQLRVPDYPHVQASGPDVATAMQRAEAALRHMLRARARAAVPDHAARRPDA
jgi:hypothetical protein